MDVSLTRLTTEQLLLSPLSVHVHLQGGWMFLLEPVHPGCPGQNPESRETVVCVHLQDAYVSNKTWLKLK